jgi:hypothetical protein
MNDKPTPITELAEFFGYTTRQADKPVTLRAVPIEPGETYEQAVARADEKRRRIEAKLAAHSTS